MDDLAIIFHKAIDADEKLGLKDDAKQKLFQ